MRVLGARVGAQTTPEGSQARASFYKPRARLRCAICGRSFRRERSAIHTRTPTCSRACRDALFRRRGGRRNARGSGPPRQRRGRAVGLCPIPPSTALRHRDEPALAEADVRVPGPEWRAQRDLLAAAMGELGRIGPAAQRDVAVRRIAGLLLALDEAFGLNS